MGSPANEKNPPDGGLADSTRKAGAQVDAVFQLEKPAHSVSIHVVGNRRTAEADGLLQDLQEREPEPFEFCLRKATGDAPRPDTGMKEALVGINVAHTRKQCLIEQGGLDGQATVAEQGSKLLRGDR